MLNVREVELEISTLHLTDLRYLSIYAFTNFFLGVYTKHFLQRK